MMIINCFFLLAFLFCAPLCSAASHDRVDEDDPFVAMNRVTAKWKYKAQTQGPEILETIRKDASLKLCSAWNAYRNLRVESGTIKEEDIPTAEEMVADFLLRHKEDDSHTFIGSVITQWREYIDRYFCSLSSSPQTKPSPSRDQQYCKSMERSANSLK